MGYQMEPGGDGFLLRTVHVEYAPFTFWETLIQEARPDHERLARVLAARRNHVIRPIDFSTSEITTRENQWTARRGILIESVVRYAGSSLSESRPEPATRTRRFGFFR